MSANQPIQLDAYSGQPTEPNVQYQMPASDVNAHPNTLPIGPQSSSSLVSTPIADYGNQPPQFAPANITNEMQQSMAPLTYSEVIKLSPLPQTQGNLYGCLLSRTALILLFLY